ncbi:MAG: SPOR domain-containing protein [Halioglobus sp.]
MNDDDKSNLPGPDGQKEEQQLGFENGDFSENPRRLEPMFNDFATPSEPDVIDDIQTDETLDETSYSDEYEDDTIDYDIDPDADPEPDYFLDEEEPLDPPPQPESTDSPWEPAKLKPELELENHEIAESMPDAEEEWAEDSNYFDDPDVADGPASWPLGPMIVAAIALVLLAAGGWGVMQQRTALQDEIRGLQAAVATSVNPEEVSASREAQQVLTARNSDLENAIASLQLEIRSLQDTNSGLEGQLKTLEAAAKAQAAAKPVPKPAAKPKQPPVAPKSTGVTSGSGDWFVNFGSYGQEVAAKQWADKLNPASGRVIVAPATRDGSTFYRVRVVDLASKGQAQDVAQTLEQSHNLTKLWVGQQ